MHADISEEHKLVLRMLGNSEVYVTCNCLIRVYMQHARSPNKPTNRIRRRKGIEMSEHISLGDFPVGTPSSLIIEAYNKHLEDER